MLALLLTLGLAACSAPMPSAESARRPIDATSQRPTDVLPSSATLFGSNVWQAPGETPREAMARIDATYGPVAIARLFSKWMPPDWAVLDAEVGERPVVVSFRLRPSKVLAGEFDDQLTAWFRGAPADRDVYWVYYHEPEDETERGEFSAQAFQDAWTHIARLAEAVDNPRLHATLILMCWTVTEHSGRLWRDYVPDNGLVDVLAWDCYAKGADAASYADITALLEPARQASASIGAAWGIGELGAQVMEGDDGHDRAAWLREVGDYAIDHGALFVTYFDAPIGGSFRLTDPPSIDAWASLVRS
jgi:hypothetical protein